MHHGPAGQNNYLGGGGFPKALVRNQSRAKQKQSKKDLAGTARDTGAGTDLIFLLLLIISTILFFFLSLFFFMEE